MRFLLLTFVLVMTATAADISFGVGVGSSVSSVNTPGGTLTGKGGSAAVLVDGGVKMFGFGPFSVNADLPVVFGGPAHGEVYARGSNAAAYVERLRFALTPGIKARLNLGLVAPWVSFGAGVARLDGVAAAYGLGSSGNVTANRWSLAMSPAGGVDVKPLPIVFFRGEIRTYSLRTPDSIANFTPLENPDWKTNLLFIASVGLRF